MLQTGAIPNPTGAAFHPRLTMNLAGLFTGGQQFTAAPAPVAVRFPSAQPSVAQCDVAPTGNVTFYLVSNLPLFLASGAPAGVLATITFAAGSHNGAIAYIAQTVAQNASLTLVMPASPDASFAGVRLTFTGDQL